MKFNIDLRVKSEGIYGISRNRNCWYVGCVFIWFSSVFISVKELRKVKKVKLLFLITVVGCLLIPATSVFARRHHVCGHRHRPAHTQGTKHDKHKHIKQNVPDSTQRQAKEEVKE